jgi:hypothetical protein
MVYLTHYNENYQGVLLHHIQLLRNKITLHYIIIEAGSIITIITVNNNLL